MRQPLLTLILLVLAFITGYELRRDRAPAPEGTGGEEAAYVHPPEGDQARGTDQAGRAAPGQAPSREEALRKQRRMVSDLKSKLEERRKEVDALNYKLNVEDRSAPLDGLRNQISQTRAELNALYAQKQQQKGQVVQQSVYDEVNDRARQLERDLAAAQMREKIQAEQASAAELARRVRELSQLNIDTDTLAALRPRAQAQAARVQELQAQYTAFLLESAAEDAALRITREQSQAAGVAEAASNIDERVSQAESRLKNLEQELETSQKRQSAGRAADETLNEEYLQKRREYEQLLSDYDDARRELSIMEAQAK